MKYAICNEVYVDWPFEKACEHARSAGYQGIEIAPFTLTDNIGDLNLSQRASIKDIAARFELEIIGLHWLLAGTQGLHLTSDDSDVRDRTFQYLSQLTRLCRDLGGKVMVLGSPNERSLAKGVSLRRGTANALQIFYRLVEVLEECGVVLALEPLGPEETNFISSANDAIDLIKATGSDHVRLHLDVKAMSTETEPIDKIIRDSSEWLVHFHANDPNRQGPGMGDVPFGSIMDALRDIDYQGWISVEVFDYSPGIERLVVGSIEYLKKVEAKLA